MRFDIERVRKSESSFPTRRKVDSMDRMLYNMRNMTPEQIQDQLERLRRLMQQ